MAFRFKKANTVVIGTFNIYIIQPAWLAEVGIIPRDIPVEIFSKLDEPGFRFSSPKLSTRWIVTPSFVQVESEKVDEDCGGAMARVLNRLPWTPLVALGNNTVFHSSLDDLENIASLEVLERVPPSGFGFAQKSIHYGLKREQTIFNLQLSITEDQVELTVNAHTELRGRKSDDAQRAAERFFEDRKTGEKLIAELFKVSMTHAKSDESSKGTNRGNGEP